MNTVLAPSLPSSRPAAGLRPGERIDEFEQRFLATGAPVLPLETIHRFTPGLYIREVHMKAGTFATSREHLTEHPYVVSAGKCSVYNAEDDSVAHLAAPFTGITKPGTRRVIVVHEDTTWITFHPTTETDLAVIEAATVAPYPEHLAEKHSLQPPPPEHRLTQENK